MNTGSSVPLAGAISLLLCSTTHAANFSGSEPEIIAAAEEARVRSAVFWTGKPLPGDWSRPCPIETVRASHSGGGATSFRFENGEVHSWSMRIEGSKAALINDVIPHEVDHAVRASLVRHPIERWLDEGCATLFESPEVQQQLLLTAKPIDGTFIQSGWLNRFDYPNQSAEIERLYAVGFSLVSYLLSRGDADALLEFQKQTGSIESRLQRIYGLNIGELQKGWTSWKATTTQSQTVLKCACGETTRPLLVIWTAKWCGSCQQFWDAWNNDVSFKNGLQSKYHIHILDYDQHRGLALLHGIQNLPTFQTQEQRVIGFENKDQLLIRLQLPNNQNQNEVDTTEPKAPKIIEQPQTQSSLEAQIPQVNEEAVSPQEIPASHTGNSWYERVLEAVPVGLTLLQWSGIIGSTAATGGVLGFAIAVLPKFLRRRQRRMTQLDISTNDAYEGGEETPTSPFPRELDEARQLLEIRQSEGRVAVLDALRGMFLDDEIEKLKSAKSLTQSTLLDDLLSAVDQRVNEVAPLATPAKSANPHSENRQQFNKEFSHANR